MKHLKHSTKPSGRYTDAPDLHPNLIVGTFQMLGWLFFHPSAWRNHILRLDPTLRPNFILTELSSAHWSDPTLRRLLLRGYLILPSLVGILTGLGLWALGERWAQIIGGAIFGLVCSLGIGLGGNLILGTAVSLALSLAIGLAGGLTVGGIAGRATLTLARSPANAIADDALQFSLIFGLMFGLGGSLAGSVAHHLTTRNDNYSFVRQTGATVGGILIGGLGLYLGSRLVSRDVGMISISLLVGVLLMIAVGWRRGLGVGIIIGVAAGLALEFAFLMGGEAALRVVLFAALVVPPYLVARSIAGPWVGAIATTLGAVIGWITALGVEYQVPLWPMLSVHLGSVLVGLTLPLWRPLAMYPFLTVWNRLLYQLDRWRIAKRPSLLPWHSAFWDEQQPLPLWGLVEHLLLVLERRPVEGRAALEYLSLGRQRWAARIAQIEMEARWLESCDGVKVIGSIHRSLSAGELTGPASALLRSFSRISQDVLAALYQSSAYNQRLALSAVEDRLDALLLELIRSSERYASRFRPIAVSWQQIIAAYVQELADAVELRQEIDNPYVIGVPLTEQQEIFVGRTEVSARIEQLLLDRRRPPLILFGQRRMGKTSLLHNLGRLLPSSILPLFVDLQGPASQAKDHTGFFYNIARGMSNTARRQRDLSLPPLPRERLAVDPFTIFDEWLDEVEAVLGQSTALVTLDEFEALEGAITRGNLDGLALLNMMRHFIQHRPRFKILLTSSRTLEDFKQWAGYLINIQVVPISYLTETEAYQLIERPVRDFELRYEAAASQRVLALTRGHPFLVQLLCGEIVAFKNEQPPEVRRLARLADVETVIPETLQRGSFFFVDIERNQIDLSGVALLRWLAQQGEGAIAGQETLVGQVESPEVLARTLKLLIRRELIEAVEGGYRFQVELIRRWFEQA